MARKSEIIAAATLALVVGVVVHRATTPSPTGPISPPIPSASKQDPLRVIARVGPQAILARDLERYIFMRESTAGIESRSDALQTLCDRTLLVLLSKEDGVSVNEAEIRSEVVRRRLVMQTAHTDLNGPNVDPSLARIRDPGLSDLEVADESREDLIAKKVKEMEVYSKIQIDPSDISEAARTDSGTGGEAAARARIQRERGAPALQALLLDLRRRWPIELEDASAP